VIDATVCVGCGETLRHVGTDDGETDSPTLHHHYRCETERCEIDGGTLVTVDGEVTQRHGPACDEYHGQSLGEQLPEPPDVNTEVEG